jgi:predicted Zn-dependent protease
LDHPDTLHLSAAEGWLELGNLDEAANELHRITPQLRAHPAVLDVRWQISIKAKQWEMAEEISGALIQMLPKDPNAWRMHANSYHYAGRYQEAHDIAKGKLKAFPKDWPLHYDLACYCCRLGKLEEARNWFHRAIDLGDAKVITLRALDDPDLEPLWVEITAD